MRLSTAFKQLLICLAILVPAVSFGATAAELQDKISTQNKAIDAAQAQIARYQDQLNQLGSQKNTLANTIKILDLQSQKLAADIKLTEDKISATNLKLSSLGVSINVTTSNIDDLHSAIGKSLREMNERDQKTLIQALTSKETFSEVWHEAAESQSFRNEIQDQTDQLKVKKVSLIADKTDVEKAKADLVHLKGQLRDQKIINDNNKADQAALLKATKNQESAYQKLVAAKEAEVDALQADIDNYESQLQYILDPKSLPKSGHGTFLWPLDIVKITQLFGKTAFSGRLYATGTHSGVDFGASIGTPVKAMAPGVVLGSGNTDTACPSMFYGKWILIKYDNGLTAVFGHLSLVKSETGARVYPGEVVAYSGKTGHATGPHLHVSVFPSDGVKISTFKSSACRGRMLTIPSAAHNAYLDPMLYLPTP